eukprot:4654649-Pyramimonas_sp.AAC.1
MRAHGCGSTCMAGEPGSAARERGRVLANAWKRLRAPWVRLDCLSALGSAGERLEALVRAWERLGAHGNAWERLG